MTCDRSHTAPSPSSDIKVPRGSGAVDCGGLSLSARLLQRQGIAAPRSSMRPVRQRQRVSSRANSQVGSQQRLRDPSIAERREVFLGAINLGTVRDRRLHKVIASGLQVFHSRSLTTVKP